VSRDLEGKVALVTGASRGIGTAIGKELARCGAKVVLAARSADSLAQLAADIAVHGGEALPVAADMSRLSDLNCLVEAAVGRFGAVDILVNNAGMLPPAKQIYQVEPEEWQQVLAVNLTAVWYLSKLVHPLMRQRGGGAIVNIASTSGLRTNIGMGTYGVSKAAVIQLTRVCAREWARDRIRVNAVAPGLVQTEMAVPLLQYLGSRGQAPNPLNMVGEPEDVAALVRYLVSDEARYVTGDVIRIDGGELL
jgi:3-oxoacyl-[acyl-carrier protein] reductase